MLYLNNAYIVVTEFTITEVVSRLNLLFFINQITELTELESSREYTLHTTHYNHKSLCHSVKS